MLLKSWYTAVTLPDSASYTGLHCESPTQPSTICAAVTCNRCSHATLQAFKRKNERVIHGAGVYAGLHGVARVYSITTVRVDA